MADCFHFNKKLLYLRQFLIALRIKTNKNSHIIKKKQSLFLKIHSSFPEAKVPTLE